MVELPFRHAEKLLDDQWLTVKASKPWSWFGDPASLHSDIALEWIWWAIRQPVLQYPSLKTQKSRSHGDSGGGSILPGELHDHHWYQKACLAQKWTNETSCARNLALVHNHHHCHHPWGKEKPRPRTVQMSPRKCQWVVSMDYGAWTMD